MEKTINQIEDKIHEILNILDDFMEKYNNNINGRAYELFFKTFDTIDDALCYLNSMKSELEEKKNDN